MKTSRQHPKLYLALLLGFFFSFWLAASSLTASAHYKTQIAFDQDRAQPNELTPGMSEEIYDEKQKNKNDPYGLIESPSVQELEELSREPRQSRQVVPFAAILAVGGGLGLLVALLMYRKKNHKQQKIARKKSRRARSRK